MEHKCDYADERNKNGYCAHKRMYCNGCGDSFQADGDNDKVHIVERKDICKESSLFGNYYIAINAQDVANLIAGKCLALTDEEYNIFISYEQNEKQKGG